MKITIHKSATADTRTCDFANTSKETLLASSEQHIQDVGAAPSSRPIAGTAKTAIPRRRFDS